MYHADPLVCRQCGGKLKVVAYVTGEITVKRILASLGLSPPEEEKPPPIREVVRCPCTTRGGRSRPPAFFARRRQRRLAGRREATGPRGLTLNRKYGNMGV